MASDVITYEDLAQLYAVVNPAGAATMRESADRERDEKVSDFHGWDDAMGDVWRVLNEVPEPKGASHTATCWKTHAPCLAARLYASVEGRL